MISTSYEKYIKDEKKATIKTLPVFEKIFSDLRIEGAKVLDVGCGTGLLLSLLVKKNKTFGTDISEKAVKIAKQKGLNVKKGDAEETFPFKTNFFDFVICKDVFEHLKNPEFTLREISRVLRKDGLLLAHVPNEFNIISRIRVLFGRGLVERRWFRSAEEWNYPHLRFFTKKGFRKFLEKNNFEIMQDYSNEWCYLGMKPLSKISPTLFSPGITFLAKNRKKR